MTGTIEHLLARPVSFLDPAGPMADIAISSRVRLARNLAGHRFPRTADQEEKIQICGKVIKAANSTKALGSPDDVMEFHPEQMSKDERDILLERRLVSSAFTTSPEGTALLVCPQERCSIMINEEDQLRIQTIRPGFQLDAAWQEINCIDDALGAELDYAFDPKLGFLTSCPTNVGTGLRASVMLHLPALCFAGRINQTVQGINKLRLAVRGIYGEGSDNRGNLFQISNQVTLGESEERIIAGLSNVIKQIICHEREVRKQLATTDSNTLLDHVGRAYGVLRHSYKLSFDEALQSLSAVRLGVDMGMFNSLTVNDVNELFIAVAPAHLRKLSGSFTDSDGENVLRAEICRNKLKK